MNTEHVSHGKTQMNTEHVSHGKTQMNTEQNLCWSVFIRGYQDRCSPVV
jgi:hypothetical protein